MENKRPNLLLDLDQTLIAALSNDEFNPKDNKERMKKFKHWNMDGYYTVFGRPHLQEFLDYIFSAYNVSVWTAASKDYALFIIDKIIVPKSKPDRELDFIFFSYHCNWSKRKGKGTKDLCMLWKTHKLEGYHRNNTLILDDYDEVKKTNKDKCIVAPPFEFDTEGSEDDTFLQDLIPKLQDMKEKINASGPNDTLVLTHN